MKLYLAAAVILRPLVSAEEIFLQDGTSEAILLPSEGHPIMSMVELSDYGFVVEKLNKGGMDAFKEALSSGEMILEVFEESEIDENIRLVDLGSDQIAAQKIEEEYRVIEEGNIRRLERRCPELIDSGIANNVVLTLTLRFFGLVFQFRMSCGEQCCARMWECIHGRCKLTCKGGHVLSVRTRSPRVCCRLNGRETDLPIGNCFDALLCAA